MKLIIPDGYKAKLDLRETEIAIKKLKDYFENSLAYELYLTRVSAPLFVKPETGLNDNLNGSERAVSFDILDDNGHTAEIVHSLAKWKRMALGRYGFDINEGLYTDMNAIRRDEELDNLHSIYVDQWDWEKVITKEMRTEKTLKQVVKQIYNAFLKTQKFITTEYPVLESWLPEEITFITAEELLAKYPNLSPKEREDAISREYGAVFIMKIGKLLSNGEKHDGRAPDYDDWELNGDIVFWNPILGRAFELSSMGIRVDEISLLKQLEASGCTYRVKLEFHSLLLAGKLPYTMGGGIGQSRICMFFLQKAHIGEVQASIWPDEMIATCEEKGNPVTIIKVYKASDAFGIKNLKSLTLWLKKDFKEARCMAIIIAILSGVLMSIQGVWNTRISEKAGLWLTSTIVHATGLLFCIAVLLVVRDENFAGLRAVNKWYFLSGIVGAGIVYTVVVSITRLGPCHAVMLILIAQVIGAYLIELFGLFGTERMTFQWLKVVGVALMIAGIFVFQYKK